MKLQVLIIDDDVDELAIFEDLLKDFPHTIQCNYTDGAESALKFLSKRMPDVIFLDVNMPKINGIECLSMIRKQPAFKHIPVIINSNGVNKTMKEAAKSLGAAACFKKTGDMKKMKDTLVAILTEVLHKTERYDD